MLRNLGISLLLLGLLGTAIDGFRVRDRVRTSPTSSATTSADDSNVHMSEATGGIPPN
jgi:hypothetical protein